MSATLLPMGMTLASCVNPHGPMLLVYPFELFERSQLRENIYEWYSPFHPRLRENPIVRFYLGWLVVAGLALMNALRGGRLKLFAIGAAFVFLSLGAARHIALAMIVTAPIVASEWRRAAISTRGRLRLGRLSSVPGRVELGARLSMILVLLLLAFAVAHDGLDEDAEERTPEAYFPRDAVDYIRSRSIRGPLFNTYDFGGYLIYRLYPEEKVFIDSRYEMYAGDFFQTYMKSLGDPATLRQLLDQYQVNYIVVQYFLLSDVQSLGRGSIYRFLHRSPDWVLTYFDDKALVYLRNDPMNAAVIASDGFHAVEPALFDVARPDSQRVSERELKEYEKAGRRAPRSVRILLALGEGHRQAKHWRQALDAFEEAIALAPTHAYAHLSAAFCADQLGDWPRAQTHARKAREIAPSLGTRDSPVGPTP